MKTVLLVPGFRERISTRNYKAVIRTIEAKGYKVVFVPITWSRTTIEDWVLELEQTYQKYNPSTTILAGFSFGAVTAFVAASNRTPSELWLFSLSPYFQDDIPKLKKSWLANIGHRRADAFRKLNFNKLAKTINCKTLLFVGEIENNKYPMLGERAKKAEQQIKNSKVVNVANTNHDIAADNYIKSIVSNV